MASFSRSKVYNTDIEKLFKLLVVDSLKEFDRDINMKDEEIVHTCITKPIKDEKGETTSEVEIAEYIKYKQYKIATKMNEVLFIVDLRFDEVESGNVKLTYTEEIVSYNKFKNISFNVFGFFVKHRYKKKIRLMLQAVESKL